MDRVDIQEKKKKKTDLVWVWCTTETPRQMLVCWVVWLLHLADVVLSLSGLWESKHSEDGRNDYTVHLNCLEFEQYVNTFTWCSYYNIVNMTL